MKPGKRTHVPGNKALSLDEFVASFKSPTRCAPTVVGPRTHGHDDSRWNNDADLFENAQKKADAAMDVDTSVTPTMIAIASGEDPAVQFRSDCEARVHSWFVNELKPSYQATRVPGKRPWPEFAASMKSGVGFTVPDAAVIGIVCNVTVGTIERGPGLVLPTSALDKPFESAALDVRSGETVRLGDLSREAVANLSEEKNSSGSSASDNRAVARALAIDTRGLSGKRLASKIASRKAALDQMP